MFCENTHTHPERRLRGTQGSLRCRRGAAASLCSGGFPTASLLGTQDISKAQKKELSFRHSSQVKAQSPDCVLEGSGVGLPRQAPGGPRGLPARPRASRVPAGPHWVLPRGRSPRPTGDLGWQVCNDVPGQGRECQGPEAGPDLGLSPLAVASQLPTPALSVPLGAGSAWDHRCSVTPNGH